MLGATVSFRDHRLGNLLLGVTNCPHCGVNSPLLTCVWASDRPTPRGDERPEARWAAFACSSCGHLVTAKGCPGENVSNPEVVAIFPKVWEVDDVVPERIANYLDQAYRTLASPDASVVMSASAIDAMLKDNNLENGSLYARIDEAVIEGILTQKMADWAHRVRLDSNNPRHADAQTPHMTDDDATRAFDFAKALTEYLYVLPSRMPPQPAAAQDG